MALLPPSLNRSESPYGPYFGRLWSAPRTHSLRNIPESCPWPGDFALASGERASSPQGPLARLGTLKLTDNPLPPTAYRPPDQTVRPLQVTQLPAGRPRAEPKSRRESPDLKTTQTTLNKHNGPCGRHCLGSFVTCKANRDVPVIESLHSYKMLANASQAGRTLCCVRC